METRGQRLQSVTIYPRYTRGDTNQVKPIRRVLTKAVYRNESATIARETGTVLQQAVFVQIFDEPTMQYVPWHIWRILGTLAINDVPAVEWQRLNVRNIPVFDPSKTVEEHLEGYWSVQIGTNTNTIIVDHIADIEIPWGTASAVTTEETRLFTATATAIDGARRIQDFTDNRRGSERVSHILLRA